jgi:hypothetical protein
MAVNFDGLSPVKESLLLEGEANITQVETHSKNAWKKVVNAYNQSKVSSFVPQIEELLKISIKDGYLSISFKKEDGDNVNYSFVSSFSKTYSIPDDVNEKEITGKVENGILEINLPKSKKKSLERFISLN